MMQDYTYPVVEWSPDLVRVTDLAGKTHEGSSLTEVARSANVTGTVILGLGRRQIFEKKVALPNIPKEEARKILSLRTQELFPLQGLDIAMDFEFTDETTTEGRIAVAYATPAHILRDSLASAKSAGLKVAAVVPVALGSIQMAREVGQSSAIVVLENSQGITLDIVENGKLVYSRVAHSSVDPHQIQAEIARTFQTAGIAELPVVNGLSVSLPDAPLPVSGNSASHLRSVQADIDIKLPEQINKIAEKKVNDRRRLAVLLLCASVAGVAMISMSRDDQARAVKKEIDKTSAETKRLTNRLDALTKKYSNVDEKYAFVVDGFEPKQHLSDVISTASNALPPEVWITGMSIQRGRPLQIQGTAKNSLQVGNYVQNLTGSSRLRDIRLVFSNDAMIEEVPVVQFSITAHVVGNFPLTDPDKKKASR